MEQLPVRACVAGGNKKPPSIPVQGYSAMYAATSMVLPCCISIIAINYSPRYADSMDAEAGDKVRLKGKAHRHKRGVVENVRARSLVVRLDENGERVQVSPSDLTNFSLAARKAWERMPDRRVGRPRGSTTTDRISVTLRIDRQLWERFKRAEAGGLVEDRSSVINAWIAAKLDEVEGFKPARGLRGKE